MNKQLFNNFSRCDPEMHHQGNELKPQGITQEEFDLKKEAEYESYGLHIRKVYYTFVLNIEYKVHNQQKFIQKYVILINPV